MALARYDAACGAFIASLTAAQTRTHAAWISRLPRFSPEIFHHLGFGRAHLLWRATLLTKLLSNEVDELDIGVGAALGEDQAAAAFVNYRGSRRGS